MEEKRTRNISEDLFEQWKRELRFGDGEAIRRKYKIYSRGVIDGALKFGYVTIPGLQEAITEYFIERFKEERFSAHKIKVLKNTYDSLTGQTMPEEAGEAPTFIQIGGLDPGREYTMNELLEMAASRVERCPTTSEGEE